MKKQIITGMDSIKKILRILFILYFLPVVLWAQQDSAYWNYRSLLIPWRPAPASDTGKIKYRDLNGDGKPDVLLTTLPDGTPVMWIDDAGTMQYGDLEGDAVNGCVCIDRNRDGIFGGPHDLCVKWCDLDNDGIADIQIVVSNGDTVRRRGFDFTTDFMIFIDFGEKDGIQNFVNWRELALRCWAHYGHSDFYTDYHGNTLFLKMHGSTFRIEDMRYSWENPFIFYDFDGDGLTEMTMRIVDTPTFKYRRGSENTENADPYDYQFTKKIDWVALSWDLDNDNRQGDEFDLDMTIGFRGKGFDYSDQRHIYEKLRGLPEADTLLYDARWRQITEFFYPDQNVAKPLIFEKGDWQECQFIFDEDDDCNRWERVEFYTSRGDMYKVGIGNGGLDQNQADAIGDRAEWDADNSGKGNLYIGAFDGRIHLYGAEWGCWRIDQSAYTYQGFGGLYDKWEYFRMSPEPEKFPVVRYTDTNGNGFIDLIEWDMDGDQVFEERVSLIELGIDETATIIDISKMEYEDMTNLFKEVAENMWDSAMEMVKIAEKNKVNTHWYNFYKQPHSLFEKYSHGFWLKYYLYKDLIHQAQVDKNKELETKIRKAYYSGDFN